MATHLPKYFLVLPLVFFGLGCAAKSAEPTLYPNEHFKEVGEVQARVDMKTCQALAEEYVKQPTIAQKKAGRVVKDSAIGAGAGAVSGAIMKGSIGRATAAGAAVGAIVSIIRSFEVRGEPSPTYQKFVKRCLEQEGYEVVGW